MQQAFCTNCGKPLAPGAAFCPSCGVPREAPPGTQTNYQPNTSSPTSYPPPLPAQQYKPPPTPKSQTGKIVGWAVGCLALFLLVVVGLIGALVYGLLNHQAVLFIIGAAGLAVIILLVVGIEHLIRRLWRAARGGVQTLEHPGGFGASGQRYRQAAHPQQHRFNPIRFVITLALMGGALYGGLFLYYSQQFSGSWSGTLSIGTLQQGIVTNLPISLSFQTPANISLSNPGAIELTQINFTKETAQACNKNGSQTSYQLSGTASRLDTSQVAMTLSNSDENLSLQGTYQDGTFVLTGTSGGKPVMLTLQKVSPSGSSATCQQATGG